MIPISTSVPLREFPGAVIGLIVANVAIYLMQIGLSPEAAAAFIFENALVPARYTEHGLVARWHLSATNYWPFITNSFMHANLWHLLVNLWGLWLFGAPLEQRWGAVRFVVVYLAAGFAASLAHFAANLHSALPALGASGAIAGVLAAFALLHTNARVRLVSFALLFPWVFEWRALMFVILWFLFQLGAGLFDLYDERARTLGGIAWWAHVGGFVAGALLAQVLRSVGSSVREIGTPRAAVLRFGEERHGTITIGGARRQLSQGSSGSTQSRVDEPVESVRATVETKREATKTSAWKIEALRAPKDRAAVPAVAPAKNSNTRGPWGRSK